MTDLKRTIRSFLLLFGGIAVMALATKVAYAKELRIYNWVDYIGPDTVANFEKETGISVIYDLTTSWETSEAKVLSGDSGYDVVYMGSTYLGRQISAGVWKKLDKNKLPNWKNIDPQVLKSMEKFDPNNEYMQPWSWYGLGIAYNVEEQKKHFTNKPDSWGYLFDIEKIKKWSECGVVWTDGYGDLFAPALIYYGKDPFSTERKDYEEVFEKVLPIRPYIRTFSWTYYDGLADGEFCVGPSWTGDVAYAHANGKVKEGITLQQVIPKEGTYLDFEGVGILSDAKNVDEAYAFLNFILKPEEAAEFTKYIRYPNPVPASKALLSKDVLEGVFYPTPEELKKIHVWPAVYSPEITRLQTRMWTKFKTNM